MESSQGQKDQARDDGLGPQAREVRRRPVEGDRAQQPILGSERYLAADLHRGRRPGHRAQLVARVESHQGRRSRQGRARRARQGEQVDRPVGQVRARRDLDRHGRAVGRQQSRPGCRAAQARQAEGGRAAGRREDGAVLVVEAGHRQVRGRHAVVRVDRHLLALGVRRTGRRELHAHATEAVGQVHVRDRRVLVHRAHGVGLRRGRAGQQDHQHHQGTECEASPHELLLEIHSCWVKIDPNNCRVV